MNLRSHRLQGVVFAVGLMLLVAGCGQSGSEAQAGDKLVADTKPGNRDRAPEPLLQGTCVIRPTKLVKLKSQVGGVVRSVVAEQGMAVRNGQVLATIDAKDLLLRLKRNEIEYARLVEHAKILRYQVARADKEVELVNAQAGPGGFLPYYSREMVNVAERRSELVDTELKQRLAELDVQSVKEQIGKSTIRAPFDGVVLTRSVEPGMVISSGSEAMATGEVIFVVGDPREMLAACVAKESDAVAIVHKMKAKIDVDGAPDSPIEGVVNLVSPVIANEGGLTRREFQVKLEKLPPAILPGMQGTVTLFNTPQVKSL